MNVRKRSKNGNVLLIMYMLKDMVMPAKKTSSKDSKARDAAWLGVISRWAMSIFFCNLSESFFATLILIMFPIDWHNLSYLESSGSASLLKAKKSLLTSQVDSASALIWISILEPYFLRI